MRLKVISCAVLERELERCASRSKNDIELFFLEQGLHNTPDELRRRAQEGINKTDGQSFYVRIRGYGLCSRGVVYWKRYKTRVVVPREYE